MAFHFLTNFTSYEDARARFHWSYPQSFNIADAVCTRHARERGGDLALIALDADRQELRLTFAELDRLASRFAAVLRECQVEPGQRVATVLPQSSAALVAQLGILKAGAVVLPLTALFGPDALEYRLRDSASRVLVVDSHSLSKIEGVLDRLPDVKQVFTAVGNDPRETSGSFWPAVARASGAAPSRQTRAEDPAFLLYTSGSTGDPKGVLHAHRFLFGHLVSFEMFNNLQICPESVFWTPADWAWIGALFDLVYPALYYGRPALGYRAGKFSGQEAFRLIAQYQLTNLFLPPTALRVMKNEIEDPHRNFRINLKVIFSGGESVTPEIFEWVNRELCPLNELYGQTEANLLVANCTPWFPACCGSMGRPVPGHQVEVIDEQGQIRRPGEEGQIALRRPDPVLFLEYLHKPDQTAAAFLGDWLLTGDLGAKDAEGYFWFKGRGDDVINAAGYRIGPTEIERALLQHPAVAECAVIGIADALRGSIVKAFVSLRKEAPGIEDRGRLVAQLQDMVRTRVGPFAYPREIEFLESLPMTTTGKIRRSELRRREMSKSSPAGQPGAAG